MNGTSASGRRVGTPCRALPLPRLTDEVESLLDDGVRHRGFPEQVLQRHEERGAHGPRLRRAEPEVWDGRDGRTESGIVQT